MKKGNVENVKNSLPALINNIGSYLKGLVSLQAQKETITNASGTIGFLINLFGKPLIDGYFAKISKSKIENFGFYTYLKAAFDQASSTLSKVDTKQLEIDLKAIAIGIEKLAIENIDKLQVELTTLVFQPKYHPSVLFVKEFVLRTLISLQVPADVISFFRKDYNDNIEEAVGAEFGDDFQKHQDNIEKLWFEKSETQLLLDCVNQNRIGFSSNEELKYEESFCTWAPIFKGNLESAEAESNTIKAIEEYESKLSKADDLIQDFFSENTDMNLEKILFIVADFGKGKSTFLRNYASNLAKDYIETGEGPIPIYFNLRNFTNYSSESQFGIIEDFLQTKYAIRINSDYFIKKKYSFLIDSLDESCDLSKTSVEKVISSIKRIQNLDKVKYRDNKIIITSRPFDDVLFNQIQSHKPYLREINGKEIGHYISLYGFKKEQFNDWIYRSLSSVPINPELPDGVIKNILLQISQGNSVDVYELLLNNETLSISELRRPIFAYMIYKLLTNNINITKTGKIGIYLSFLNLLSKEAKYIYDPNYRISLMEQFEARSILHSTAALWNYEKQNGKQGFLKKADLCRMIERENSNESDEKILDRYKNNSVNKIEFLSHSYFGDQGNILHFQHQSFAEILLAEYYIKIIIKFSLDRNFDLKTVITKLTIGNPTHQTIQFLSEILVLLKETVSDQITPEVVEKRKLILPLLASISIDKNNPTLYSDRLYYEWFEKGQIDNSTSDVPDNLINDWCLNVDILKSVCNLCKLVVESDLVIVLSKSSPMSSLFNNEVTVLKDKSYNASSAVYKYLCLLVGNKLDPSAANYSFINSISFSVIQNLLNNSINPPTPLFKRQFEGFRFKTSTTTFISNMNVDEYAFDNCYFEDILFLRCRFTMCSFCNVKFRKVIFYDCDFSICDFTNASLEDYFLPINTVFRHGLKIPSSLIKRVSERFFPKNDHSLKIDSISIFTNHLIDNIDIIYIIKSEYDIISVLSDFKLFFKYGIINSFFSINDIFQCIKFENSDHQEKFTQLLMN